MSSPDKISAVIWVCILKNWLNECVWEGVGGGGRDDQLKQFWDLSTITEPSTITCPSPTIML